MGLKSGSRDAGLDDSESDDDQEPVSQTDRDATEVEREPVEENSKATAETAEQDAKDDRTSASDDSGRPTMESLPYKLRRNKVNEGREQVPYFLREEVIDAEGDLQDTLEEILGETVYKSDYREAAMVVAQRNPELIADVLREWGYDLEAN